MLTIVRGVILCMRVLQFLIEVNKICLKNDFMTACRWGNLTPSEQMLASVYDTMWHHQITTTLPLQKKYIHKEIVMINMWRKLCNEWIWSQYCAMTGNLAMVNVQKVLPTGFVIFECNNINHRIWMWGTPISRLVETGILFSKTHVSYFFSQVLQ